jgi:hypothetical protein
MRAVYVHGKLKVLIICSAVHILEHDSAQTLRRQIRSLRLNIVENRHHLIDNAPAHLGRLDLQDYTVLDHGFGQLCRGLAPSFLVEKVRNDQVASCTNDVLN